MMIWKRQLITNILESLENEIVTVIKEEKVRNSDYLFKLNCSKKLYTVYNIEFDIDDVHRIIIYENETMTTDIYLKNSEQKK